MQIAACAAIALLGTSISSATAANGQDDYHLLILDGRNMPPAYNKVYMWSEGSVSIPFSLDPFDKRISTFDRTSVRSDFKTVLPVCKNTEAVGCIAAVEYSLDGGNSWQAGVQQTSPGQREVAFSRIENGKWVKTLTSTYSADADKGIWEAAQPNYWKLSGAKHAVGENYFINVVTRSQLNSSDVATMKGLEFNAYAGEASAYTQVLNCPYWPIRTAESVNSPGEGYCFEPVNLPENLTLRVKVNFGKRINELSGWFDGRLADAQIDFGTAVPGQISVQGRPIAVNIVQTVNIPKGDPNYDVDEITEKMQFPVGTRGGFSTSNGVDGFLKLLSKIPDVAYGRNTNWRVSSWQQSHTLGSCKGNSGVQGIVLTNATTYESSPPRFNVARASLDFRVASSHLNPNGELNVGEYKLLVQQKLANCLWGANLNGAATVSVVEDSGVQTIATTSFKNEKGWAIFYAAGFHYSVPTISVSIRKKPSTVLCVKTTNQKVTKKVTAVNAKCPAGYKKK